MTLRTGEKLGPYELVAPIGAGGMDEVWKARDTRLDRIVALKVSKTEFTQRFEHEAYYKRTTQREINSRRAT